MTAFERDVQNDIENIRRIFEAEPERQDLPPGFAISDAMAAQIMFDSVFTIDRGFPSMEQEGGGASYEKMRFCYETFAGAVLMLHADRQSQLRPVDVSEVAQEASATDGNALEVGKLLTDASVERFRRDAHSALERLAWIENNPSRFRCFGELHAGAHYFVLAAWSLCLDRYLRKQLDWPLAMAVQ